MSTKLVEAVFAAVVFASVLIIIPIITAALGGFGAWACGLLFEDTIRSVLRAVGINLDAFSMFQIGATLGFVSSYFRPSLSSTRSRTD